MDITMREVIIKNHDEYEIFEREAFSRWERTKCELFRREYEFYFGAAFALREILRKL